MTDATTVLRVLAELGRPNWKSLAAAVLGVTVVMVCMVNPTASTASSNEPPMHEQLTISLGTAPGRSITALAPGDAIARSLDVTLSTMPGSRVMLAITTVGRSSLLDSDEQSGLRVGIDRCVSLAGWRRTPRGAYVCNGRVVSVLAPVSVAQAKDRHVFLAAMAPGRAEHVRVMFTLPSTAGNAFERLVSSLKVAFSTHA